MTKKANQPITTIDALHELNQAALRVRNEMLKPVMPALIKLLDILEYILDRVNR